jgi:glycosyltransferase involved in cell wall biosynthesis
MSYQTQLGICIPTYKRPDQLRQCVLSIIASAEPFAVPIFIADDSTDATNAEVIAELQGRYPHIVYERNAANLGIDRNILHSVDICRCEYAWLMGEDDRMKPEGVSTVLAHLAEASEPPAFIAVNYSSVDEHISYVIKERLMMISADCVEDADTFFRREAPAIGFIGGCVINTALWRTVDPTPYLDTYFAHAGRILESVHGKQVSLVAAPLVLNRTGGAHVFTWSDDAYGVFEGWPRMVRLLEPLYGPEACCACLESFQRLHGLTTLRFLCAKRADNLYNLEMYRRSIQGGNHAPLYRLAAWLIALSPSKPFALLSAGLAAFRAKRNPRTHLESSVKG